MSLLALVLSLPLADHAIPLTLKMDSDVFLSGTSTVQAMLSDMGETSIPHTQSVLLREDTKVSSVIKDTFLMTF